jgi:hypothetical protein
MEAFAKEYRQLHDERGSCPVCSTLSRYILTRCICHPLIPQRFPPTAKLHVDIDTTPFERNGLHAPAVGFSRLCHGTRLRPRSWLTQAVDT